MRTDIFQQRSSLIFLLIVLAIMLPVIGNATTVTNTSDGGPGSLREAIAITAPGGLIDFNLTLPATITLSNGDLVIANNLTISGPGAQNLTIDAMHNGGDRIFTILAGAQVSISGLTITGGRGGPDGQGGGVHNAGTLTFSNCVVIDNQVPSMGSGGMVPSGGGIFNATGASLTVDLSTVTGNRAGNQDNLTGGGIRNANGGSLSITRSTISNNFAPTGGGIWNDGGLTIDSSTISGNDAGFNISSPNSLEGGGLYNNGTGNATIVNSTLANNQAKSAGSAIANYGTLVVSFSAFSGNLIKNGAGTIKAGSNTMTLRANIVAASGGNSNCGFGGGALVSVGDNLSDDNTCATAFNQAGDLNNTPAGLDALGLQNNGGPTQTIALLSSSLAVDHVVSCTDAVGNTVSLDQRGLPRQSPCDIGAFELPSNRPIISGFSPTSGPTGTSVTINGSRFTGATGVTFNGTAATNFSIDSDIQITATVPSAATTGPIAVTNSNGAGTSSANFTVTSAAATITSFTPTSGRTGTSVTITGTRFTGATAVAFNGTAAANFNVDSDTQITATVSSSATSGPIRVTTPAGIAASNTAFTVIPTITSFTPTSGPVGTSVTISGANFLGATSVTFNGAVATTFAVNSAVQITAFVPSTASTGPIAVSTSGAAAISSASFTVTGGPSITAFSPTSGGVGTSVTITGMSLTTATAVSFGGVKATFKFMGQKIVATVPSSAVTGRIQVDTPAGSAVSATNFTVLSTPSISGFAPQMGPVGTQVTINGTGLAGATNVMFGTKSATFTINSETITATVPNGAKTGLISVTTPGGAASSAGAFTVTK